MDDDGNWRCEKCDRSYPAPVRRYIFSANVADYTGQIWVSGFNEVGETLLGITADELDVIQNESEAGFKAVLSRAIGRVIDIGCRAKQETFNDSSRVRYTMTRLQPVDFKKAGHELVNKIHALQTN